MKIIDPHLHLFDLSQGQYGWLKPECAPFWPDKHVIARNFSTADLTLSPEFELAGFVHIEAGFNNEQPWQELAWLERCVKQPFRTIGSVDLTANTSKFIEQLNQLAQFKSLVGVRHILDQQASALLSSPQVITNLAYLSNQDLIFEAQLDGSDTLGITALVMIAQQFPELTIIINHAAFAPINRADYQIWQHNIKALSPAMNIYIKASGWEMVDRQVESSVVESAITFLLEQFGVERVMLASNFPLCLFSKSYHQVWDFYTSLNISDDITNAITYQNAAIIYRF